MLVNGSGKISAGLDCTEGRGRGVWPGMGSEHQAEGSRAVPSLGTSLAAAVPPQKTPHESLPATPHPSSFTFLCNPPQLSPAVDVYQGQGMQEGDAQSFPLYLITAPTPQALRPCPAPHRLLGTAPRPSVDLPWGGKTGANSPPTHPWVQPQPFSHM